MRVNSVDSYKNTNFQALKNVKYLGRFNPETSESARIVWNTFNKNSWAIQTLIENYHVKAVFSTRWFKGHPQYTKVGNETKFDASYAQVDLFFKEISKKAGLFRKIKDWFTPWRKVSLGEYSNYHADKPLSEAELKLAYTMKRIEFSKLMRFATDEKDPTVLVGPINNYDYLKL